MVLDGVIELVAALAVGALAGCVARSPVAEPAPFGMAPGEAAKWAQMNVHFTDDGHYKMNEPDSDGGFHVFAEKGMGAQTVAPCRSDVV